MTVILLLVVIIALGSIYVLDAIIVFPALVLGLSFLFVWGAAPCWHFERRWREKYSKYPEESMLIDIGLAPKSRRQASGILFIAISLVVLGLAWLITDSDLRELVISGIAAFSVGASSGLVLHYVGHGSRKIESFFESIE